LEKYSKGRLKMGQLTYEGFVTRGMRWCIGAAILLLAATPFVLAVGKLLHWIRWW